MGHGCVCVCLSVRLENACISRNSRAHRDASDTAGTPGTLGEQCAVGGLCLHKLQLKTRQPFDLNVSDAAGRNTVAIFVSFATYVFDSACGENRQLLVQHRSGPRRRFRPLEVRRNSC